MRGGCIPDNAVRGGVDGNGETNYVARAVHEGNLLPGRVASTGRAYVSYENEEYCKEHYEVLLADCDVDWIEWDGENQPTGIIQGGLTKDGEPLYIGRAHHRDFTITGKVQLSKQACFIPFDGEEWSYEDFEVLVCGAIRLV
ncbi:hypothetical protein BIW11_07725 [Tropilaelaps mercedesae]|uniref:Uncharacterized protein n=1 Tax=Tropilaelaps mercedesae TaxID=418985 RepID=A0A1V9XSS7_9ACAR|nr:hypothetical protein BIW11_07725 [Tropilaelaps mercedesae]